MNIEINSIFRCTACGENFIEEVITGATVVNMITSIDEDLITDYDYGSEDILGGEVARYQCGNCGRTIAESKEELYEFLNGIAKKPAKDIPSFIA